METKGGKYDTGSTACNQGEIVTVPLKTNGGAKAITCFEVGKKLPDPLAVVFFVSWDGIGYRLDDLACGIHLMIATASYQAPLFERTVNAPLQRST